MRRWRSISPIRRARRRIAAGRSRHDRSRPIRSSMARSISARSRREFLALGLDPYPRKPASAFDFDDEAGRGRSRPSPRLGRPEADAAPNRPRRVRADRGCLRRLRYCPPAARPGICRVASPTPDISSMTRKVRIALDAMGGDHGPRVVIPGAALALERHPGMPLSDLRRRGRVACRCWTQHPALAGRHELPAHRRRRRDGRQAEPGAAPGPLEVVHVAGASRR